MSKEVNEDGHKNVGRYECILLHSIKDCRTLRNPLRLLRDVWGQTLFEEKRQKNYLGVLDIHLYKQSFRFRKETNRNVIDLKK